MSTLHFPRRPEWVARVEALDPDRSSPQRLAAQLLRSANDHDIVVLNGAGRAEQALVGLLVATRRRPAIVLADATWRSGGSLVERVARRAAIRAIDGPRMHYCVLSSAESRIFPSTWGVDPGRVFFTPWYYAFSEEELAIPTTSDGGVFAGGNSLRDYSPLVAAGRGLSAEVTIASDQVAAGELPPNVHAGPVPPERYMQLMRSAEVVVVALAARHDRSAGQQTYLTAMAIGKPVVVTDVMGVRDYVEDGVTGHIVPPADPVALRSKLEWVLDPANRNESDLIVRRAREVALARFGPDQYVRSLLRVIERAAATTC
ncbi:MAG: glycosyltransferase [Solirubrobacterales bacterium]|nr:glycosyltransferase [Solirubrobacterales bacterium]